MRFSEFYKLKKTGKEAWFDPWLNIDTRLFLDPFLLYAQNLPGFEDCHKRIIDLFNSAFIEVAKSSGDTDSIHYKKAQRILRFPEVRELCLGYSNQGIMGSGSGRELTNTMVEALWEAVEAGITEITHFEEIALIRGGVGADRISDIVANIIRPHLANYTYSICKKLKIPVRDCAFARGKFDSASSQWTPLYCKLPINPYSNTAILLVPEKMLRVLPSISPDDFWDYCYSNENEILRQEFGEDISRNASKEQIVLFAKKHKDLRQQYLHERSAKKAIPYDFEKDPTGQIVWDQSTQGYVKKNPKYFSCSSPGELSKAIQEMMKGVKHFIENNGGWNLLWNDDKTAKGEKAFQLLSYGIYYNYCKANNIDVTREAETGKGPVDFKVSQGFSNRVLIEAKKANNSKFWHGLRHQLPAYMRSQEVKVGYFLILILTEQDLERVKNIKHEAKLLSKKLKLRIETIIVDGRPQKSASAS